MRRSLCPKQFNVKTMLPAKALLLSYLSPAPLHCAILTPTVVHYLDRNLKTLSVSKCSSCLKRLARAHARMARRLGVPWRRSRRGLKAPCRVRNVVGEFVSPCRWQQRATCKLVCLIDRFRFAIRLKLKCDKTIPCSSCRRRGCSQVCRGSMFCDDFRLLIFIPSDLSKWSVKRPVQTLD